ncbi:hypothetical protein GLOTRDRAFT_113412 [Gloeophyllum trabeum ATCC 11539]|uniref:Glutamine amidotransferase type-2 domain-containing protein n=1 Tax=Gloeophyllum trabeum (strain ATCC 11539 / FP-39264 / Madison 617) TaxID=670483 RepID=S7QN34_GLOTA|nr:uncharacterized protein GLOTRDRAFT_113412 [Gloeophyllum trabeum ATCC 11539]EPQ60903.1 hypothetical protein GLOTRDRAFT_113412 [Gloeophyllum trabeum ATCC 11539]
MLAVVRSCQHLQKQIVIRPAGPDAQKGIQLVHSSDDGSGNLRLSFFSSELRLRGEEPVVQPHYAGPGSDVLCFNGEIFEGVNIKPHENDGSRLYEMLQACETLEQVRNCIGSIEGPYAFVFYQHASCRVFFARDPLGRRSLLIHRLNERNPHFLLTSVSIGPHPMYQVEELDTTTISFLELREFNGVEFTAQFASALKAIPRLPEGRSTCQYASASPLNRIFPDNPPRLQSLDVIPDFLLTTVDDLISQLEKSVRLRVQNIPRIHHDKGPASVAVLFSGGIDCTMIAFLADRYVPSEEPIDLLNVAFENPRKIGAASKKRGKRTNVDRDEDGTTTSPDTSWLVPDRAAGLEETQELRKLCPTRRWNFVEINVTYQEYQAARETVEALMFPSRTVMDLSLAMALYFASRGQGQVRSHPTAIPEPYTSPARVLLNGLGADELFGGYARHRTTFNDGGWGSVLDELQLEIDRIPTRNLGRDDRVISSHGKETRHPFLSLSFLNFVAQLPVHHKMDPRLDTGVGDKMLLRLAVRKLGLIEASSRKKRAMQFGSHSARMEGGENDRRGDLLLSGLSQQS